MYLKRWLYLVFLLKISTVLAFVIPQEGTDSDEAGLSDAPQYSQDEANKVKAVKIKLDFNAKDPSKAVAVEPLDYEIPDISNAQEEANRWKDIQITQDDVNKIQDMMKDFPNAQAQATAWNPWQDTQNTQDELNRVHEMIKDIPKIDDDALSRLSYVTLNYKDFKFEDFNSGTSDGRLTFLGEYMLGRILLYVVIVILVIGVPACIKICCPNCCRKKQTGMVVIVSRTKSEDMQQLV